jgi:tetratricopeptide (TPR) repeat protein
VGREVDDKTRRFIDRGLARYGRGQLKEAVAEWEQALAWDAANSEARTLIDFVNRKLELEVEQGDPDRRNTDPVLPRFEDAALLGEEELGLYNPESLGEVEAVADIVDDDAPTGPHSRVRVPTLESPIPQLLAQITSPEFEPPAERDDGAPELPVFGEETRRLGSEPHADEAPPTVAAIDLPEEHTAEMRILAEELIERCRTMLEKGKLEAAVSAAESALREGERAPPPGIDDVLAPAWPIFERSFEAYVGSLEQVPILAISEGALASQGLDHRAGFLLSRIDGVMHIEHLLDIAGMPRAEAMRILALLLRNKTIRIL